MSKIVLTDVSSGFQLSKINENFQKIEDELNNKVLYRDAPTGEPNALENNLDVNGKSLYNIGDISLLGHDGFEEILAETEAARDVAISVATDAQNEAISAAASAIASGASAAESSGFASDAEISALSAAASAITAAAEVGALAVSSGAALVGFTQSGTGAVAQTVDSKLKQFVSVKDFGAVGDGVHDDTDAVQAAVTAAAGKKLLFPFGAYVIDSVSVASSIEIVCDSGVIFRRKASADTASGSYWITGAAMFEIATNGVTFKVSDFTYDGNNSNQTTTEPTGWFVKTQPPSVVGSDPITVQVSRGVFIGGTSGYVLLRGDDVNRRYETFALIEDCRFYDTVLGKGKGDPSTPNALGYNPTYMLVMDYVRCRTMNFHAQFDAATGTGEYAPTALNGTFFGAVYANSGESYVWMHGTTYMKNMGRSAKKYNDDTEWVTNNGIGSIDMYGNTDTLFIEHLIADDCQNVPARAKGSTKNFTVMKAVLNNCHRGIQVGPSTTGPCETVAYVGSLHSTGGTIPQIEFTGTSTSEPLLSVKVSSAYIEGTQTNPEALVNIGTVRFRNTRIAQAENVYVASAPVRGVDFVDCNVCHLNGVVIDSATAGPAILVQGGVNATIENFSITNAAANGVVIQTNPTVATVRNGKLTNSTNYAVFANTTTTHLLVENVESNTVTGTGRAFYAGGGDVAFVRNKSTGAAVPLFVVSGTNKREDHNSWNPVIQYAAAPPTAGAWKVGDITYNYNPPAGGTPGWVCVTAGTPGTWKAMANLAA